MRLLSKISYYHFWLSLFVLSVTGFMLFIFLRHEISMEIEEQLDLQADMIAEEIHMNKVVSFPLVQISKGDISLMRLPKIFKDTLVYDRIQQENEGYYYLTQSKAINGDYYRIKVMTTYIGWSNYSRSISYIFIIIIVMLVLLGTVTNYFISSRMWSPFLHNLRRMTKYSVSSNEELILEPTDIKEFQEMNTVLADLAARGKKEYTVLKQFTENASHEIQTPLSILKTRLESISQFPLDAEVVRLLRDAKIAVTRLSKVNKSLLLLAKLENDVFEDKALISLEGVIHRNYEFLEDLFQHKELTSILRISPKNVYASTSLMDILMSNMLSNMLRYTPNGGEIQIILDEQKLVFSNQAPPLTFPHTMVFSRFTKSEVSAKRNGLGLSIVRQICINHKWNISYSYANDRHHFEIVFS